MKKSESLYTTNAIGLLSAYFNLSESVKNQTPDNYSYLWSKFYLMNKMGYEKYAKGDYFHYPLQQWVTNDFKSAINQIVDKLKGSSIDNPITIGETITIHNIAYCAHFKIHSITHSGNINEVKADHMIEDDKITLYFIQKK